MPEVVEVCLTALYLNQELRNKKIVNIKILGGRYSRHPLKGLPDFKNNLPLTINKIDSKGKFMWFELSNSKNNYYILNTFGLEGMWGFNKKKHSHIIFEIKNNKEIVKLYFTDSRNFGTIEMTPNKKILEKKLNSLGPDFLKENFSKEEFYNRIKNNIKTKDGKILLNRANKKIVKVLMDQSKNGIGSGLGNYLSAEILYCAKISPHKKLLEFYKNKYLAYDLAICIKKILKFVYLTAEIGYLEHLDPKIDKFINNLRKKIRDDKNYKYNFHPDIKIKNNAKFKFIVYRQKKDPFGNKVKQEKIIPSRTTYWVPNIQK